MFQLFTKNPTRIHIHEDEKKKWSPPKPSGYDWVTTPCVWDIGKGLDRLAVGILASAVAAVLWYLGIEVTLFAVFVWAVIRVVMR